MWALVGERSRSLLGRDLGLLRHRVADAPRARAPNPVMPGARWFEGRAGELRAPGAAPCRRGARGRAPAIVFQNERMRESAPDAAALVAESCAARVASLAAAALRGMGVQRGDRVCAFLPNTPHAIVAFLARWPAWARSGRCARPTWARWRLRFRQIEPKVLIGVDGYVHGRQRTTAWRCCASCSPNCPACGTRCCCQLPRRERQMPPARPRPWPARLSPRFGQQRGRVQPRMAALRPPAMGCLFERHHRPAQAHRARPWRHRCWSR